MCVWTVSTSQMCAAAVMKNDNNVQQQNLFFVCSLQFCQHAALNWYVPVSICLYLQLAPAQTYKKIKLRVLLMAQSLLSF